MYGKGVLHLTDQETEEAAKVCPLTVIWGLEMCVRLKLVLNGTRVTQHLKLITTCLSGQ